MFGLTEVLLAVITFLLLVQFQKIKWAAKRLPLGPRPLPIIGNLWTLDFNLHHETLMKLSKTYGSVFTLWAGPTPVVVVNGYDAVRDALVSSSEATSGRAVTPIMKIYGKERGIIGSNGHIWRQQRRFGVLTLRKLGLGKNILECRIQDEARHMVEYFASSKGKPLDPSHIFTSAAANVICAVILGHRFAIDDDIFQHLSTSTTFLTHFMGSKWGQVYEAAPSLMRFIPGPHHMYTVHWNYLSNYMRQEVKSHQENPADEPQDFIDCYLEQISKTNEDLTSTFDEDNLNQLLIDFFVAGSETITLSLLWALLHMVAHPEIQEKVQMELNTVLGPSKVIEYEDRKKLPYTNAMIHEVQRYNTVVPTGLPRWCLKDSVIQGIPVEKDTILLSNLASVNCDPEHWETPRQFNPNHFLDDVGNFVMKEAFLTFSAGHRVCLGERLAKTELFLFFSNMLREFTFRPATGENGVNLDSMFGTTLQPVPYKICAFPNQDALLS